MGALPTCAGATMALSESSLPPISATGHAKALPPPELRDASGQRVPGRLLQVQTVFRHGARLPVNDDGCRDGLFQWSLADSDKTALLSKMGPVRLFQFGDGDPLDPLTLFGDGSGGRLAGGAAGGRLTPLGLSQAVDLGNELRARYVDTSASTCAAVRLQYLLPGEWERARRLVATRSTNVERTVYTAAGVLYGLYPPAAGSAAPEVEISLSGAKEQEFLVLNDAACPRLSELFSQGQRLSAAHLDAAQRDVIEEVEGGAGWFVSDSRWKLICYRDWYSTRRAAGKPIPTAVERVAAALDSATAKQMHAIFEGGAAHTAEPAGTRQESLRLVIGRLWSHVLDTLSKPDGTLHLYSGHDWSVSPLLMCVVAPDDARLHDWPPFCSNIAIELWSTREADVATPRQLSHHASCGDASANDAGRHVRVLYVTQRQSRTAAGGPFL